MQPPKQTSSKLQPLAVVGYALRYPGDATTPEKFWDMLIQRKCASSKYPADRLNIDAHYNPTANRPDTLSVNGGHFITGDLGAFDAPFFSLTTAEAEGMDPQQRMALEVSYQALENAGISLDQASGTKTCVFSGCSANDYGTLHAKDPQAAGKYIAYSQAMCMIANRISWAFNLAGPSANVDTACSSSLVALDMACQSIWSGASTMGLALGVNLILAREWSNSLDNLGFFSQDNRCFSFSDQANGYSRGEGLGALIIKPLEDAILAGDTIRAVIRSTLSNQDGRTPGITQPSRTAQQKLIEDAYLHAGLSPAATRYFEAHGTGTAVGDPTESRGIGAVFRPHRSQEEPLYLGSVKSNIGHLEGGSGIAGVIKVILSLERGIIPPVSDYYKRLNPRIDAEHLHVQVVSAPIPWPEGLRRASVSSFGFGGANSHVILDDAYHFMKSRGLEGNHNTVVDPAVVRYLLETDGETGEVIEHPSGHANGKANGHANGPMNGHLNGHANGHAKGEANGEPNGHSNETSNGAENGFDGALANGQATHQDSPWHLLTWSSADKDGLGRLSEAWEAYLDSSRNNARDPRSHFANLAYTLNERRTHHPWRSYALSQHDTPAKDIVASWSAPVKSMADPTIGFVFTGQGAQWPTMGRELMARYPVYLQSLRHASGYLRTLGAEWDILDVLQADKGVYPIDGPRFAQPLCTAIQIALIDLLETFGLHPAAVVGHSSGEIAAAYCYGAISREYALKLAYFRGVFAGKLAQSSRMNGAMMAVSLSEKEVQPYLDGLREGGRDEDQAVSVVVGCFNSPKSITLSGQRDQLEKLQVRLKGANVLARLLPVPVGYHSFQMQEVAAAYSAAVGDDESSSAKRRAKCRMVSSVHGNWASKEELSVAQYWVTNLVSPVRFVDAVRKFQPRTGQLPTKKIDGSHRESAVVDVLFEIGPHGALRGPCRDTLLESNRMGRVEYLSALVRNRNGAQSLLEAMGRLHCLGAQLDFAAVNLAEGIGKVLTDLPAYSFNHVKSYWHEGRVSKGFRFRKFGRQELLGWPEDDWNPLQPKWSNILHSSDPVWVRDHAIDNVTILPGAAMITMAIEAIKQVTDDASSITGFELKNVNFRSALKVVPGGPGVETRFYLHPPSAGSDGNWFGFTLCSYDGSWVTNCDGTIQVVTSGKPVEPVSPKSPDDHQALIKDITAACTTSLDASRFYEMLGSFGYQFGPAFVRISSIACDDKSQLLTKIVPYPSDKPHWTETYTIHPTTLDGLMQTVPTLRSRGGQRKVPISVPRHVSRAWISPTGLSGPSCSGIKVGTKIEHIGRQECVSNISAFDESGDESLIRLEGVVFATIDSQSPQGDSDEEVAASKCQHIEWKPDLQLMTPNEIQQYCNDIAPTDTEAPTMLRLSIDTVVAGFISRIAKVLSSTGRPKELPAVVETYLDWISRESSSLAKLTSNDEDEARFETMCELVGSSAEGRLVVATGHALLKFARGELDASDILSSGLLKAAHAEAWNRAPGSHRWTAYLDALAHKQPGMKILEVDGGAGSVAESIIATLKLGDAGDAEVPRFSRFDIASTGLDLPALQQGLGETGNRVALKEMDLLHEPAVEERGQYDLVVLHMGLGGSMAQETILRNSYSLMKPGGKVVIIETTKLHPRRHTFIHGLNETWWMDELPNGSLKGTENKEVNKKVAIPPTERDWDSLLRQIGFTGTELVFTDYEDSVCHETSIIVSTTESAVEAQRPTPPVIIISNPVVPKQQELAVELASLLGTVEVDHYSLSQALTADIPSEAVLCILYEVGDPFLADIQEEIFQQFQQLFSSSAEKVIWVNSGAGENSSPSFRVIDGLFRVLNSELSSKTFATLSLGEIPNVDLILRVVRSITSSATPETEYVERSGILQIPRLVNATEVSRSLDEMQVSQAMTLQPWNAESARKLSIKTPGLLDSLHFVEDTDRQIPLPDHMMEVKVKAVGVNFRDILIMLGRMDQTTVGFECAGIVTRVGADCGDFKIGDRVLGCEFDTYRSYARLQKDTAVRIPDGISFTEAAAIPINFITAWHALVALANTQSGEKVLIHSAAGGTGQAAVQVAQYFGAEVFATVGSVKKKQLLMDQYGIPESHIFSSRNRDFVAGIKRLTNGQGADVILNSLSGDALPATWEIVAPYGRFIEIGKRDILGHRPLDMYHFEKNVTFSAIDVAMMVKERPALVGRALRAVVPLIASGALRLSSPHMVYGIGEMETGLRALQGGQSAGKVVLEMRDTDLVRAIPTAKRPHLFDPNATYVIAGGLGGLGRGIARWMASCGARYLLLLSRRGAVDDEAAAFLKELAASQISAIATPCDITDYLMLEAVLGAASHRFPPIKGCIQATMVLKDTIFETMTHDQWAAATNPKIKGTWNLHQLLPSGLDFFVMMSSISSIIGNRGQANYAAANSYMDGLAHYRHAQGERATSLNLGLFLDAGVATQSQAQRDRYLANLPFNPITEGELHALLAYHCNSSSSASATQTIMGLEPSRNGSWDADTHTWLARPAFRHFALSHASSGQENGADQNGSNNLSAELASATSPEEAAATMTQLLVAKLAKVLGVGKEEFDTSKPMHAYGVDSLVAVEMRNWFAKEVKADMPIFDMLGGATIEGVAVLAATRSKVMGNK
ncbi:type I polyketide synthase [Aspergillus mulundensis]|uniref:Uncharacterized protein n=1 Tax=Aspergillus mulundensis TaxID=1810919 RepID=A0A3D8T6H8_9EURO|nr:Uncharacterized protein DSM5745_01504 [Aspergillus mulundensis]RDW94182.1 Uncharacterized protein DSM5745_01504 [Aspergillus mulundensis]